MTVRPKSGFTVFLIFLAGFVIGGLIGGKFAYQIGAGNIVDGWVREQAGDATARMEILKQLRTGTKEQAIELLETRLDEDLVSLLPEYHEGFELTEQTGSIVQDSIESAKKYRATYPRPSKGTLRDKDVARALGQGS